MSLELGGKSACVVFADADWERAAAETPMAVFANAGQDCCARSRIVVEASIYDDFVAAFARATEAITVGAPLDDATEVGPMISDAQRRTSLDYIGLGMDAGAERVTGGVVPDGSGFYLTPAVLAGVDNDDARRPRGDLRSGGVDHPVPGRGRRRAHRQRHALRALGLAVDAGPRAGRCASPARCAPACSR